MTVLGLVSAASVSLWSTITSAITNGVKDTGANRGSVSNAVVVGRFGWFTNAFEHIGWIGVVGLALLVVLFVVDVHLAVHQGVEIVGRDAPDQDEAE